MFSFISIKFKISSRFTGSYMLLPTQYTILQQRLNQLPALIQFTRIKYSSKIYQFDLDPTLTPDLFVLLLRDLSLVVDLSLQRRRLAVVQEPAGVVSPVSHLVELVTECRDLFELVLQLKLELFFLLIQGLNKIKNISGTENYLWDNESNLIISQGVKQLKQNTGRNPTMF